MNLSDVSGLFRVLKALDRWIINRVVRRVDCFVLLTRHMAEPLGVSRKPWMVMEGAVNPDDVPVTPLRPRSGGSEKVVLYTGTLHKAYGILELLEAFSLVRDPRCRLWICGAGDGGRRGSRPGHARLPGPLPRSTNAE